MDIMARTGKSEYTETEAAEELGVSTDRLRTLIRNHVIHSDEDLTNIPLASFQPSDLLLLRFLTLSGGNAAALEESCAPGAEAV